LSDDEVAVMASELAARGELNIDVADIGAAITRITDELPSSDDLDRVQRRLGRLAGPSTPTISFTIPPRYCWRSGTTVPVYV
jgi:Protein of unknown function (DUF3349)